jgi:hypothetical protein
MDYVTEGKRKTKNDKKKKRKDRAYKRGGKFRSSEVAEGKNKGSSGKG